MAGSVINVINMENSTPHAIDFTIGTITGFSPPNQYAVGKRPAAVVKLVITMGLNLLLAPVLILSIKEPF